MQFTTGFYWDMNDETRAFAKRFYAKIGTMPSMVQAGAYSATTHYLRAVKAVGSDDAEKVTRWMKDNPINDFFAKDGRIREDGRMVHDMYLAVAKTPAESKADWDLMKIVRTIPGEQAFKPLAESTCKLVKK
jgi:branched-chain amino acid transport system substrate-binding protein